VPGETPPLDRKNGNNVVPMFENHETIHFTPIPRVIYKSSLQIMLAFLIKLVLAYCLC
jgi:hypothetical protein